MSEVVKKDWDFSDKVFLATSTRKVLEKHFGSVSIRKATKEEDMINNIDYHINNIPIQWRTQRYENIKGSIHNYNPTFRYSRSYSSYEDRKDSEFKKILRNRQNGLPYPKLHFWCLVDKNFDIKKSIIIDVDKFVSDYQNNEYEIWDKKKGKKINDSSTEKIITLVQNYDNSSEFIILNEKFLLPKTIVHKYTST